MDNMRRRILPARGARSSHNIATATAHAPQDGRARALFGLRKVVRRDDRFLLAFRALRAFVHFGPWRRIARAVIRMVRPAKADLSGGSLAKPFLGASEEQIAGAVEQDGYCLAGPLPPEILGSLRELTDRLPIGEYRHADQASPAVASLVHHDAVLGILRRYFRSEPALLECSIVVTDSTDVIDAQSVFHFDFAGWQSMNMFVYLTDVSATTGPHVVIKGTHHGKSIRDSSRPMISNEEAERRFAGQIQTLTGPAGTMIFENTEAFHKRGPTHGRRAIINALYASHRGAFSQGRGGRSLGKYLARTKERAVVTR